MSVKIVKFPHVSLKTKTNIVTNFNADLGAILDTMKLAMISNRGLGLAANQIDCNLRMFVMLDSKKRILELVNPEILEQDGVQLLNEGCLSGARVVVQLPRAKQITVKAQDRKGEEFKLVFADLEAVIVQHEMDHLNGEFFFDKAPRQQRKVARKILKIKD